MYGFSALSSVYATHNVIASIDSMDSIGEMLFNPEQYYFQSMKRNLREKINTSAYKTKGLASLYRYKKGTAIGLLNKSFDDKHASYIFLYNRKKYQQSFTYTENENSIFDGEIDYGLRHEI